jgi:uncharacterized protein (DUF305 family)
MANRTLTVVVLMALGGVTWAKSLDETPFLAENTVAMNKMMAGMAIRPSGDIDQDFTAMMIPHHLGAIDMARAELRYGHNEQLRRIAQGIIVEQQQEITAMNLAIGPELPAPVALPGEATPFICKPEDHKDAP